MNEPVGRFVEATIAYEACELTGEPRKILQGIFADHDTTEESSADRLAFCESLLAEVLCATRHGFILEAETISKICGVLGVSESG